MDEEAILRAKSKSIFRPRGHKHMIHSAPSALHRESNIKPPKISKTLTDSFYSSGDGTHKVRNIFCFFGLSFLMICVIALMGLSLWMELQAYNNDVKWNKIVEERENFILPEEINKKLWEVEEFFPASKMDAFKPKLKTLLARDLNWERAAMLIMTFCIACCSIHIVLFVVWSKFRKKLIVTYIGYGLLGWCAFAVGAMIAINTLGLIPYNFLNVRTLLEDNETFVEENVKIIHHGHIKEQSCGIHKNHKLGLSPEMVDSLTRLRNVSLMCAYRYSQMNFQDPCKNLTNYLPSQIKIREKVYKMENLTNSTICPLDDKKVNAMVLAFSAAILCIILMGLGSYFDKMISVGHATSHSLYYRPSNVNAIEDLSIRKSADMPSFNMSHKSMTETIPLNHKATAITPIPSRRSIYSETIGFMSSIPFSGRGPRVVSNPENETQPFSIMTWARGMVIRPPTSKQHKSTTTTKWFNDKK